MKRSKLNEVDQKMDPGNFDTRNHGAGDLSPEGKQKARNHQLTAQRRKKHPQD